MSWSSVSTTHPTPLPISVTISTPSHSAFEYRIGDCPACGHDLEYPTHVDCPNHIRQLRFRADN